MIYFHVNARVESIAVNLNLWFCTCVLLHPQLVSYVKQYGIRHKTKYMEIYGSFVLKILKKWTGRFFFFLQKAIKK